MGRKYSTNWERMNVIYGKARRKMTTRKTRTDVVSQY